MGRAGLLIRKPKESNILDLRPSITYVIENAKARGKFLGITSSQSGPPNGRNVKLWDNPDCAYSHWQLEFVDGYCTANEVNIRQDTSTSAYYAAVRHVHSDQYLHAGGADIEDAHIGTLTCP